jgi:CrcB protein
MARILVIGLGGFIGAIARYGMSALVHRHLSSAFPYGTLVVNLVGCVALGGVLYLVEDRSVLGPEARAFLVIGLIGGFTTFSSFGYETLNLLEDGHHWRALLNVAANVILGLAGVWLGRAVPAVLSE